MLKLEQGGPMHTGRSVPGSSRNAKTYRIVLCAKEDVISDDRVKGAVVKKPPDLPHGHHCADPCLMLLHLPITFLNLAYPFLQPPPPNPNFSDARDIRTLRISRRVHFPDPFIPHVF
ncbi:unnamed protein product [Dibothriocephalus latus]|uniref:Uncharacterized protein n=1 Tax=Dibothriocephalus latus TaxID=60516 RepID=A0A3P6PBX0_DIBLA|nr:unnamed protein product [Dibothriocephalus latus]